VTLGRILHWFNPVLWLGFQRMAVDRELACDELALRRIGEAEAAAYGKTILKLVELCDRPVAVPGMAGVLEERGRMRRRIEMIASFKPGRRWSTLGAVLLMVVGLATLTDAQQAATNPARQFDLTLPAVQKPPPDATNSNKPKLTINRIVVDDSGKVFVNNEYVPDAKLKEKVQSLQAADPDLRVVVKGSGDTKYRDMLKVLDVLQKLNVTKIGLATQEETGGVSPHY
jgi:biopolymer transport protein ExbD